MLGAAKGRVCNPEETITKSVWDISLAILRDPHEARFQHRFVRWVSSNCESFSNRQRISGGVVPVKNHATADQFPAAPTSERARVDGFTFAGSKSSRRSRRRISSSRASTNSGSIETSHKAGLFGIR